MKRDWWEQPSISRFIEKFNDNIHINVEQIHPNKEDCIQIANNELIHLDKNENFKNGFGLGFAALGLGLIALFYSIAYFSNDTLDTDIINIPLIVIVVKNGPHNFMVQGTKPLPLGGRVNNGGLSRFQTK